MSLPGICKLQLGSWTYWLVLNAKKKTGLFMRSSIRPIWVLMWPWQQIPQSVTDSQSRTDKHKINKYSEHFTHAHNICYTTSHPHRAAFLNGSWYGYVGHKTIWLWDVRSNGESAINLSEYVLCGYSIYRNLIINAQNQLITKLKRAKRCVQLFIGTHLITWHPTQGNARHLNP